MSGRPGNGRESRHTLGVGTRLGRLEARNRGQDPIRGARTATLTLDLRLVEAGARGPAAAGSLHGVDEPQRLTLSERAQPLLEEAAERSRASARTRADRVRHAARAVLQATLAATVAWLIATELVGHDAPFFAPVSAMITLGLTQGQRGRRAVEVVLGVTLGIAIADLLVILLGTGAWQLALVVAFSMTTRCCSAPATCSPSRPRSPPRWSRRSSRPTTASPSPAPSTR